MLDSGLVGAWRSLVAHQSGGLVVVGSNPAAPTIFLPESASSGVYCVQGRDTLDSCDPSASLQFG